MRNSISKPNTELMVDRSGIRQRRGVYRHRRDQENEGVVEEEEEDKCGSVKKR